MQAARGASLSSSDQTSPDPQGPSQGRQPGGSQRPGRRTAGRPGDRTGDQSADRPARRRRYLALFAGVAAVAYATDVVSKVAAVASLTGRAPVEVVGPYFTLYLARNPGAAFSTGTSYTLVLTCIAIVAAVVVMWVARRLGSLGWAIGLGFLLAGITGNLTDRVFRAPGVLRGHVVDFFMFPHFPVFNVADVCINIAAAVIIVQALRGMRVDGRRHEGDAPEEAAQS